MALGGFSSGPMGLAALPPYQQMPGMGISGAPQALPGLAGLPNTANAGLAPGASGGNKFGGPPGQLGRPFQGTMGPTSGLPQSTPMGLEVPVGQGPSPMGMPPQGISDPGTGFGGSAPMGIPSASSGMPVAQAAPPAMAGAPGITSSTIMPQAPGPQTQGMPQVSGPQAQGIPSGGPIAWGFPQQFGGQKAPGLGIASASPWGGLTNTLQRY